MQTSREQQGASKRPPRDGPRHDPAPMLMMLMIANQKPMSLEAATPARPTIRNAAVSHTRTLVRMWVRQKVLMADTTCQWEAGGVGVRVGGVSVSLRQL